MLKLTNITQGHFGQGDTVAAGNQTNIDHKVKMGQWFDLQRD